MAQVAARDNGFAVIVAVSAIILLWLFYSRTIFKRLEAISRPLMVAVVYASLIGMVLFSAGVL
jgi:hypothetical protein